MTAPPLAITPELYVTYIFPGGLTHDLRVSTIPVVGDDVYFRGGNYRVVKRLQVFAKTLEGTIHDTDYWHVLLAHAPAPDWSGPAQVD